MSGTLNPPSMYADLLGIKESDTEYTDLKVGDDQFTKAARYLKVNSDLINPGIDKLKETGLNDKQIKVKPVFSICNPGDASDITNFDQKLAPDFYQKQYEKKFEEPLNNVLEVLSIVEKADTSPIMEMIQHVSVSTFPLKETKHGNRLIIISDMIQNSPPNFSMYSSYDFNSFKNSSYYKKINTNLRDASIYILKTRQPNFEHLQGEKLIKFWQSYFKDMDSGNFTIDPVEG